MSIIIIATNAKGADLLVNTTVEPTTVKEATEMLAGIKSGVTLTTGKRNRVHGFVIVDSNSGREITFERDENGTPVQMSDVSPVVKSTNTNNGKVKKMNKVSKRLKMQTDTYTHRNGNSFQVVITAAKGGGKIYALRAVRKAVKGKKGVVVRPASDITRELGGRHELVNGVIPFIDANGYRLTSRERVAA